MGLGPQSPLVGMLSDLPTSLTPGWQAVDMAVRCLKTALRAAEMQKMPHVVALLQRSVNELTKLESAYTSGTASGSSGAEAVQEGSGDETPPENSTADSQPAADVGNDAGNGGED